MKFKKLFNSKEHYLGFRAHWSKLVNSDLKHTVEACHHALYALLRDCDIDKCFTEITNANKLANGFTKNQSRDRVLKYYIKNKSCNNFRDEQLLLPFKDFVSKEMLYGIRLLINYSERTEESIKEPIFLNIGGY